MKNQNLRWIWVAILVVILDQWAKQLALQYLILDVPHPIWPMLNFTLAFNQGAAFGFLNHSAGWQRWLFILIGTSVSIGVLIWLGRLKKSERFLSFALALVLGGAVSNLWDRIYIGHVIDFIDLYVKHWHWPIFNIADAAICTGVFLLIWNMWLTDDEG